MAKTFSIIKNKVFWDKQKVARFNNKSFCCEHHCLKTMPPKEGIGRGYQVAWCNKINQHCNVAHCPIPETIL